MRSVLAASCLALAVGGSCQSPEPQIAPAGATPTPSAQANEAPTPSSTYLKGQLHLHSASSGDSQTPPADVVRWYEDAGYDFIVFTDHNRITQARPRGDMLVFAGIELTQNPPQCDPAPEPGLQCLLHVNGLFVDPMKGADLTEVAPPSGVGRIELYAHALQTVQVLGGIAMLDHPNFHYAADGSILTALAERGLMLFEVANEAVDSNNEGDQTHPSTEALWDEALAHGARLYGVATDDAHHYDDALRVRARGELAHVGDRGWIMVRADRDEASIRGALQRGDFYATNGVLLLDVSSDDGRLRVAVGEAEDPVTIEFIGQGGTVLHTVSGREASFELARASSLYVRARVSDARHHRAWAQPVWP